MADHFITVHEVRLQRADWRKGWEKEVLMHHGGLCAVPGCTRAAKHNHHIIYRSQGQTVRNDWLERSDDQDNIRCQAQINVERRGRR